MTCKSGAKQSSAEGNPSATNLGSIVVNLCISLTHTHLVYSLKLSYDVRDIRKATSIEEKEQIYMQGANALPLTLQSLSLQAESRYGKSNVYYNIYRNLFGKIGQQAEQGDETYNSTVYFDGAPVEIYADTLVQDLFKLNLPKLEADGILATSVLMAVWGSLFSALEGCRDQDTDKMNVGLDSAAAYWVGAGQRETDNDGGYSLYHMAEEVGADFMQDLGESSVNKRVVGLLNTMQERVKSNACANDPAAYSAFRRDVRSFIAATNVVMVQKLLFYVQEVANFESDHVELFSLSILPQVAACNTDIYTQLLELTVSHNMKVENRANAIRAIQESFYCLGISCEDVGGYLGDTVAACDDTALKPTKLSTYELESDVILESRLDLDLKHLDISLHYGDLQSAKDYYEFGWYSSLTLKKLASQEFVEGFTETKTLFSDFFGHADFADRFILAAFEAEDSFSALTLDQRSAAVMGLLQGPVLYTAVANDIETAIEQCYGGDASLARKYFDRAVAFYVGSSEGISEGGQEGGEMIFALAKQYCKPFGQCEPTGAALDGVVLVSMKEAANFISDAKCQNAETVYRNNIKPPLVTPAIQGTLYNAAIVAEDPASAEHGALFGISRTLLPVFTSINATETSILQGEVALTGGPITHDGLDRLFGSLTRIIRSEPNLDCKSVGKLKTSRGFMDVCDPPPERTKFVPKTDVLTIARLSQDVNEMRGQTPEATRENIYLNGKHALPLSLSKLSLEKPSSWDRYPLFIMYKHAFDAIGSNYFNDVDDEFEQAPTSFYADSLVKNLFALNRQDLEAQSVLVLHVLMACWGALYDVLAACKKGGIQTTAEMNKGLDTAAAYYFGSTLLPIDEPTGYSLYDLAEEIKSFYVSGTNVNEIILDGFLRIQNDIEGGICSGGAQDYGVLRKKVRDLMLLFNVPVMQILLYHVRRAETETSKDYVELFSLALLPQLAVCSPNLSNDLFELTVASKVTKETQSRVERLLEQSLNCLGISCADLGAPEGEYPCNDSFNGNFTSVAGYHPTVDVRAESFIDRDAKQIQICAEYDQVEAALDIFEAGWNTYFSMEDIASPDSLVSGASSFTTFKDYYSGKGSGDLSSLIIAAVRGESPFDTTDPMITKEILGDLFSDVLFYFAALSEFESAVNGCSIGDDLNSVIRHWDTGVAFFVGSAEGHENGGVPFGGSLFATAKRVCGSFDRCEMNGNAIANAVLFSSFEMGSEELLTKHCSRAQEILEKDIKPHMMVPLLQELILYGALLSLDGTDLMNAYGLYVHSLAIIPEMNKIDPQIASEFEASTSLESILVGGLSQLFRNLHDFIAGFGISCDAIGVLSLENLQGTIELDLCDTSYGESPSPSPVPAPSLNGPETLVPSFVAPEHPDGLAWGRFDFINATSAESDADFSLDIKSMYISSSPAEGEAFYVGTRSGLSGLPSVQSLAQFSTEAWKFMSEDPMFNFFRAAFFDDSSFDGTPEAIDGWSYGDSLARLALSPENGNSPQLAAETVVVMNVWMMITHKIYECVALCRDFSATAAVPLDSAVALWIGKEQGEGRFDSGYMLYSIAQKAFKLYGNSESESPINTNLMDLFVEAQTIAKTCSDIDGRASVELSVVADDIVRLLTVPLLQNLLYYISKGQRNMVQLYSLGFVPQAYSCGSDKYEYIGDTLVDAFSSETINDEKLKLDIAGTMSCLRLSCDDLGFPVASQGNNGLSDLVSSICSDLASQYDPTLLAGFPVDEDMSSFSRIDLDIHQIDILMRTKAYGAALNIYLHGRNSPMTNGDLLSLSGLATTSERTKATPIYDLYKDYFGSEIYSDALVLSVMGTPEDSDYASATRSQLAEIVFRTLQTQISFLQIMTKLRMSVEVCRDSGDGSKHLNEAVALFVGSMEGSKSGGIDGVGRMLMGLGKEMCQKFQTCESHGDATENTFIMFAFSDIAQWLSVNDCTSAEVVIDDSIVPAMLVPMIQGVISSAADKASGSSIDAVASGSVMAQSVLPFVEASNSTSAQTISDIMEFDSSDSSDPGDAIAVAEAFSYAIREMNIECGSIGSLKTSEISVCVSNSAAPDPDTATNLGDDLYVTTTYVKDRAGIALDVKQMEDTLKVGRQDLAQKIYEEGLNSPIFDELGTEVGLRSMALFSTNALLKMNSNPLFHVAVHALEDENGMFLGRKATEYADSMVREAFNTGGSSSLAAEAAVSLNIWMELANELYQTVERCTNGKIADDDGIHSIDEAAAYWIGDGQLAGDPDAGHLLYALAEKMGFNFQMIGDSGQSRTNTNILRLFHQAKIELSYPDACKSSSQTVYRLNQIVNKIASLMTATLAQSLIHYLHENDSDRIRLYGHAFVPLTAVCEPDSFKYLKSRLIEQDSFKQLEIPTIVSTIRSLLPCLGLTCDDIGIHVTESQGVCTDPGPLRPLAGYRPSRSVGDAAMIDLDILELDILIQRNATEAARNLYSYGRHSIVDRTTVSLRSLSRSPNRELVPELSYYKEYYENEYYADALILQALTDPGLTVNERRATVTGIAQYFILPMAAKTAMYNALIACEKDDAAAYWDMAVAYLTGSLEGKTNGGSDAGNLLWSLGKEYCSEFGTCSQEVENSAEINDDMQSLFYAGRGAISSRACDILGKTVMDLSPLMFVAILQAILKKTVDLVVLRRGDQRNNIWSETEVLVATILPVIEASQPEVAEVLEVNYGNKGNPIPDGIDRTARAISQGLKSLKVNCEDIGVSSDIDPCLGVATKDRNSVGIVIGVLIGLLALVGIGCLLRMNRHDETAVFVKSKGELNHTTDLVPKPVTKSQFALDATDLLCNSDESDDGSIV